MSHVCEQVVKNNKYMGYFSCKECSFEGTLTEAIAHIHKHQFVIDARLIPSQAFGPVREFGLSIKKKPFGKA